MIVNFEKNEADVPYHEAILPSLGQKNFWCEAGRIQIITHTSGMISRGSNSFIGWICCAGEWTKKLRTQSKRASPEFWKEGKEHPCDSHHCEHVYERVVASTITLCSGNRNFSSKETEEKKPSNRSEINISIHVLRVQIDGEDYWLANSLILIWRSSNNWT